MAVTTLALGQGKTKYIGESTDTKPTIASHSGLPQPGIGSTFYEYDTGILYITYDGTNWVVKDSGEKRQHEFYGLSTDTKPTVASHAGLPEPTPGSLFYEYTAGDTATIIYFTPDGTNWYTLMQTKGG